MLNFDWHPSHFTYTLLEQNNFIILIQEFSVCKGYTVSDTAVIPCVSMINIAKCCNLRLRFYFNPPPLPPFFLFLSLYLFNVILIKSLCTIFGANRVGSWNMSQAKDDKKRFLFPGRWRNWNNRVIYSSSSECLPYKTILMEDWIWCDYNMIKIQAAGDGCYRQSPSSNKNKAGKKNGIKWTNIMAIFRACHRKLPL